MNTGTRVKTVIAKALALPPEEIREKAALVEDFGVSSLDRFELIMDLETEFGIEIREEDFVDARTVGDIVRCIDAQIKPQAAS